MRLLILICMLLQLPALAQTEFQKLSFDEALAAAKAENKLVFVDCYTTWCGPCKLMAERILPLPEVGDYLNARFVCLQIDMEKGEGPELAKEYGVDAFPTFLVVNPDGTLKNRVVGASQSPREFVYKMKMAAGENPTERLDSMYAAGNRMGSFMVAYLQALDAAGKTEQANRVMAELMPSLNDSQKAFSSYWFIYESPTLSPAGSENEEYFLAHLDAFRKGNGPAAVDRKAYGIYETRIEDIIRGRNKTATAADVEALGQAIDAAQLPGDDYLKECVALALGVKRGDAGMAFDAFMKMFPDLDEKKIAYLYFTPLYALKGKWTAEQKEALTELSLKLSERVENVTLKDGLKNFAESEIPKL